MKKLIIAAALVCSAICSQASVFDWSFSQKSNASAGVLDISGYKVYVMTSTAYTEFAAANTLDKLQELALGPTASGVPVTDAEKGVALAKSGSSITTYQAAGLQYEATWSGTSPLKFVLVDTTESKWAAKDSIVSAEAYAWDALSKGQTGELAIARTESTQFATADFTSFAIPEPTSGLLLLLGVAGLALRRRRA